MKTSTICTESKAMKEFNNQLKVARESRKLSQGELAQKIGVLPSVISLFERGKRKPSFDMLKKIATGLDVTTDFLFGFERGEKTQDFILEGVIGLKEDRNRILVFKFIEMLSQLENKTQ
jgi:transcriptional regulator with XRE-family HTH domain